MIQLLLLQEHNNIIIKIFCLKYSYNNYYAVEVLSSVQLENSKEHGQGKSIFKLITREQLHPTSAIGSRRELSLRAHDNYPLMGRAVAI